MTFRNSGRQPPIAVTIDMHTAATVAPPRPLLRLPRIFLFTKKLHYPGNYLQRHAFCPGPSRPGSGGEQIECHCLTIFYLWVVVYQGVFGNGTAPGSLDAYVTFPKSAQVVFLQADRIVVGCRFDVLVSSVVFFGVLWCWPAAAIAQHSSHPTHPPMSDTLLFLRIERDAATGIPAKDVPLVLTSAEAEKELNQSVEWAEGEPPLRLIRYLPHGTLEQTALPADGESARPAVELVIEGPTQSVRRWLLADDPARNRLTSYIGTWRFISTGDRQGRDDLLRQFETEFEREPQLLVSRPSGDPEHRLPLRIDTRQAIEELGSTVRVLRFFPDYSLDREKSGGGEGPVNRSQQRRNPAVLVEIAKDGRTEQRWVFAKFPRFGPKEGDQLPIRIVLDCPVESSGTTPDFVLVSMAGKELERWARYSGRTTSSPLALRESVEISGSQYTFQVVNFLAAALLSEDYKSAESGTGVSALQVEVPDRSGGSSRIWLALGESKTTVGSAGAISLLFHAKSADSRGGHP